MSKKPLSEPLSVLYRLKRGLAGYVSYLAACEMNKSFSEYVLYEPILRILTARGYTVDCEVICPGLKRSPRGDWKRIDFVAGHDEVRFALEIKWAKKKRLNVQRDHEKLVAFRAECTAGTDRSFLCVFGPESVVANLELTPNEFEERGRAVVAQFGVTRFGCRTFELRATPR